MLDTIFLNDSCEISSSVMVQLSYICVVLKKLHYENRIVVHTCEVGEQDCDDRQMVQCQTVERRPAVVVAVCRSTDLQSLCALLYTHTT